MKKILIALLMFISCWSTPALATKPLAPDFTLRDLSGAKYNLSQHQGEIIILNFWATWCGPCTIELPYLNDIDKNYANRGVNVVTVSIDAARRTSLVRAYIKSHQYGFTALHDRDTVVISQYNPSKAIPYTVIINREGRIVYTHVGYSAGDEITYINIIEEILHNP
jgi:peroxiredoxin